MKCLLLYKLCDNVINAFAQIGMTRPNCSFNQTFRNAGHAELFNMVNHNFFFYCFMHSFIINKWKMRGLEIPGLLLKEQALGPTKCMSCQL